MKDLSRVMRLPGFLHQKKDPFVSKIIEINSIDLYRGSFFVSESDKHMKIHSPKHNEVKENKNKILEAIYNHGLFRSAKIHPKRCYDIECPWKKDHTSSDNTGDTKYFEPHKDGYDSHGFKCFHNHCKDKNINDLCSFLGLTIYQHLAQPTPLFRKVQDPVIFPVEALGVRLSAACRDLNEVVQAPMTICAQSLLSATALVTQPFYNIIIDGRSIPLSLYFITVGESGERKTGIDKVVLHTIREYQKMTLQIYYKEMYQFKNQYDAWSHKRDKAVKAGNVPEVEEAPKPPLDPIMLLAEPTFPSLVTHLSKSIPSIGLFSDEGGRLIGGHAMREENVLSTAAGLSALWDAGEIDRARVKDGVYNLYGKRLSLSLMIQPIVAQQIFSNPILIGQGLLSRCLIPYPKSTIGSRIYKSENIYLKPGFKNFKDRVVELMDRSLSISPDNIGELSPLELSLSQESCNRWIEFHNEIEYEMRPNGKYEQIKAVAAKIAENALRIAEILSVFEYINPSEVKITEINNAIKICEFYLSESLRLPGLSSMDQDLLQANKLLAWLHEKKVKRFPTIMIYQKSPNSIRSQAVAKKLLNILKSHGWIIGPEKGEIDNIKHKEIWIVR